MTSAELRALAERFDQRMIHCDCEAYKDATEILQIIHTVADLQEPARKALFEYVETARSGRSTAEDIVVAADALAAIVQRIVEVGE